VVFSAISILLIEIDPEAWLGEPGYRSNQSANPLLRKYPSSLSPGGARKARAKLRAQTAKELTFFTVANLASFPPGPDNIDLIK
jgi:hypothetical protein